MSVFPKKIVKGKDKFVTLHMHVDNKSGNDVLGKIVFIILKRNKKIKRIEENVLVKSFSSIDNFYKYNIKRNFLIGRYRVDGRFYFGKYHVRSETYKNDFFDILQHKQKILKNKYKKL